MFCSYLMIANTLCRCYALLNCPLPMERLWNNVRCESLNNWIFVNVVWLRTLFWCL